MPSTKFILLTCLISLCGSKSTAKVPYSRNEDSSVKHEESLQMSKLFNFFFKSKPEFKFKPSAKSTTEKTKHYELAKYIIDYVFENYPEYKIPLLSEALLRESNISDARLTSYTGLVMEVPQEKYNLLITDSYSKKKNGILRNIAEYPSAHKCTSSVRYCSRNPTFCQYQQGSPETQFIIIVSRGGNLIPEGFHIREDGCIINGTCIYTKTCEENRLTRNSTSCPANKKKNKAAIDIATKLTNQIEQHSGSRPHLLIMNLHTRFIDPDIHIKYGAVFDSDLQSVWLDYHTFIADALTRIKGRGLVIDLYTHSEVFGMVELDYSLEREDEYNTTSSYRSSISALQSHAMTAFEDLVIGKNSLENIMLNHRLEVLRYPSRKTFNYVTKNNYTIAKLYGSFYGGKIDSIKMSIPKKYYDKDTIDQFTEKLGQSLFEFYQINYKNREKR